MSNKSDSGSEDTSPVNGASGQYDDDICRDYMRNVCTRGKRCRYRHPTTDDRPEPPQRHDLTFCHDYQNNGCNRPNCKFLHCSRDEEEYFHRTGLLPSRLNHANSAGSPLKNDLPLCRDYLNGDCKRGSKCKYRHDSEKASGDYDHHHHHRRGERHYDYGATIKRRRVEDDYDSMSIRSGIGFTLLEDENIMLKRKIEELKKQVSDLTAINEVLLDQNARFRISKAAASPYVNSNQALPALAMSAAVNPGHAQASINQMNSALTQQVALNSDLATQHAIAAQRMAAAVAQSRTPQSAMVNPSVTLTQNVASALALTQSNMSVSMASMPQLQVAHSLTQNLGAPSTTLVSYPIMSHCMRSAVEPSSLTH